MSYLEVLRTRVNLIEQEISKTEQNLMMLRGHLAEATHHLGEYSKFDGKADDSEKAEDEAKPEELSGTLPNSCDMPSPDVCSEAIMQ